MTDNISVKIKTLFIILIALFCFCGCSENEGNVKPTPDPDNLYLNEEFVPVTPDINKYTQYTVLDDGEDIYIPFSDGGYRYGPSIITNADGSIDAWFSAPGVGGEWDWITYRHYDPIKGEWSDEVSVLQPTPDSMDHLSCCDPGVIYFNGYYYIGYTSTIDDTLSGTRNNVFVARSMYPDGPYEKWNGSGWGGKPAPIVYYDGEAGMYGAGEPSFVELEGTLYIYYTWKASGSAGQYINRTLVSTADATKEDWPKTIEYKGIAIDAGNSMLQDSADIKYIDNYGKFIAICTDHRFDDDSFIAMYESNDGITFYRVSELRSKLIYRLHNSGISGRPNGHINVEDDIYIGYAYGENWGCWATRFHKIEITLGDEPDFSDRENQSKKIDIPFMVPSPFDIHLGITTSPHHYQCNVSDDPFLVGVHTKDVSGAMNKVFDPSLVKFTDYNKKIISFDGFLCTPKKVGTTFVTANYEGMSVSFIVTVYPDDVDIYMEDPKVVEFTPFKEVYEISLEDGLKYQIRGLAIYENDSWNEIFRNSDRVEYSGYDTNIIKEIRDGVLIAKNKGSTEVTVSCDGVSFKVTVIVL